MKPGPQEGYRQTETHKRNRSLALMGHEVTEETRQKLREALKGKKSPRWGKHHTEVTKEKQRIALVGIPRSEETKLKLSLALKGRLTGPFSKERRQNMSMAAYNRKVQTPLYDTFIEIKLQKSLAALGIEFEAQKRILGRPDIFLKPNICIFADGDYWHTNSKYHLDVEEKDLRITRLLQQQGYVVLRFREYEINNNLDWCMSQIKGWFA